MKINVIKPIALSILTALLLLPAPKANALLIIARHSVPAAVFLSLLTIGKLVTGSPVSLLIGILDEKGNITNSEIEIALAKKHPFLSGDREALTSLATLVSQKVAQMTPTLSCQNPQVILLLTREEILNSIEMSNFSNEQVDALVNDLI